MERVGIKGKEREGMGKFEDVKKLLPRLEQVAADNRNNCASTPSWEVDRVRAEVALQICALWEQPKGDSLEQPSPLTVYPTCASDGSDPPLGAVDQEYEQATIRRIFFDILKAFDSFDETKMRAALLVEESAMDAVFQKYLGKGAK